MATVSVDYPDDYDIEVQMPPVPRAFWANDYGPKGKPGDPGTDGAPGAIPPSVLADRPAASSVPAGTEHYATDSSALPAISTGSAWVTPPVPSPYVTRATDSTTSLTTTIAALNTNYRIGSLETSDVTWPGGLARVSLLGLLENNTGHVLGSTDSVTLQKSTDSGATWAILETAFLVGFRQSAAGTVWMPEQPLVGLDGTLTAGATVRFRAVVQRFLSGTVPVTVPWQNATRSLVVESLR